MLKSDNYAIWRDSYKAAIMSAGAWTLITGEVVRPAVTIAKDGTITNQRVLTAWNKAWEDKLTNAIQIITSTVYYTHLSQKWNPTIASVYCGLYTCLRFTIPRDSTDAISLDSVRTGTSKVPGKSLQSSIERIILYGLIRLFNSLIRNASIRPLKQFSNTSMSFKTMLLS
jgi:hypothetical protein